MQSQTGFTIEQFPQPVQDLVNTLIEEELGFFEGITQNPQGLAERAKSILINQAGEQLSPQNFTTTEGIALGNLNLDNFLNLKLEDETVILHPHTFGFTRNKKGLLVPNPAGRNGLDATALVYKEVEERGGNPILVVSANLTKGKIMQGTSYAEASAKFVARHKKLGIPEDRIVVIPQGSDARGEMKAGAQVENEIWQETGKHPIWVEIQQALYMKKLRLYGEENNWNFIPVATESIYLKFTPEALINRWTRIFSEGYLDKQEDEYKKQLLMLSIALDFDKTGRYMEFVANLLGTFKEQLEGRQ